MTTAGESNDEDYIDRVISVFRSAKKEILEIMKPFSDELEKIAQREREWADRRDRLRTEKHERENFCVGGWRMWTTLFFRVLLLLTVTIATASTASDDVLFARLNYGVVMKRVAVIDIVTDSWNQAFIVRLPVIESSVTEPSHINCSNITTRTLKATCLCLHPMALYLHNASVKAVERIHTVIHYIRSIVPEQW